MISWTNFIAEWVGIITVNYNAQNQPARLYFKPLVVIPPHQFLYYMCEQGIWTNPIFHNLIEIQLQTDFGIFYIGRNHSAPLLQAVWSIKNNKYWSPQIALPPEPWQ